MIKNKKNIDIWRTVCLVVLIVTIFSSYFLAKYVSTIVGSDSANVAKWSVDATPDVSTLNLVSGNTAGVYTLTITSTSEVSTSYSVILDDVPSGMEVKIDNGSYQTADSSGDIIFNNVGSFAIGDATNTHIHSITFNSPLESNMPSINEVDIDVRFTQED